MAWSVYVAQKREAFTIQYVIGAIAATAPTNRFIYRCEYKAPLKHLLKENRTSVCLTERGSVVALDNTTISIELA